MNSTSEREQQRPARQRAMSLDEFSNRYGPSRTKTYEEIKAGGCARLNAANELWLRRTMLRLGSDRFHPHLQQKDLARANFEVRYECDQ